MDSPPKALPLVVALGAPALDFARAARAEAIRRGAGLDVLAFADPPPPPIAAPPVSAGFTRSVAEFTSLEVPARPRPPLPPPLPASDLLMPPLVTLQALRAALDRDQAELPAAVTRDPERWLRALGDPPRADAWAHRLLFERAAAAFAEALERRLGGGRPVLVLAAPGDALGCGSLLPALAVVARLAAPGIPALAMLGGEDGLRAAHDAGLLDELEARSETILLLAAALSAAGLVDLLALWEWSGRPAGRYRGRPLAYAVVSDSAIEVDLALEDWRRARAVTASALAALLAHAPLDASQEALALEAEIPLPAALEAGLRSGAELLRDAPAVSLPLAASEDLGAARRRIDAQLARRIEESADRQTRLDAERNEWLDGGKLSLLGGKRATGFRRALEARVSGRLATLGATPALALLRAVGERLHLRDSGASAELKLAIADLEARRASLAPALRADPQTLAGLLGRKDAQARVTGQRALAEYARLTGELARLHDVLALASSAEELLARAREAVDALASELERLRAGATMAASAVGAAEATSEGRAVLARALESSPLGRWAASAQALIDDLWSLARAPVGGAALLDQISAPGAELAGALAAAPALLHTGALPRRLLRRPRVVLHAPGESLARRVAGELPFAPEVVIEPHGHALRLIRVDTGLPRSALVPALPDPPPASAGARTQTLRGGERWQQLLAATLGARDLVTLAQAGEALARSEALLDEQSGEEIAVLCGLEPLVLALRKAHEVSDTETRVHYLEEARLALDAWAESAAQGLVEPERGLAADAALRWCESLERSLASSRGRAELGLRLRTRRLGIQGPALRIEVEVSSSGSVAAESVSVQLLPGPGYRVLGEGRVLLGRLPVGSASVVSFQVRPPGPGTLSLNLGARWDDRTAAGNTRELSDVVELHEVRAGFRRLESNPYIAGPPVKSERMFFGRDDVFRFVRDNLSGRHQNNVLLLHGNRRTGKSSLLYQLERGERVAPFLPVYLDLQGLGRLSTASLFAALARKLARTLAGRGHEAPEPPERAALEGDDAFDLMNEFLDAIESSPWGAPPVLVMLDEFEILEDKAREGRVDPELFGWLRAKMQHSSKIAFLLAGTHRLSELDPVLWAPLLSLCLYRHVSFLSEAETRELVTRPVEGELDFDDLALEAILRLTGGHPYYVQLLCQLLVTGMNQRARSNVVGLEDIHAAASELLDAGGGQFSYEWRAPARPEGRVLLAALAELSDSAASWVDLEDLAGRAGLARELAEDAARDLVGRDLLMGSEHAYRLRVDLFRQWLRRERSVARARAEASA